MKIFSAKINGMGVRQDAFVLADYIIVAGDDRNAQD
jgi:hypothetical protein